jgi:acylpyruvate hydrolase
MWWKNCSKIVAIGRNYPLHAKELGNAVPSKPFWFLKPPSSFLQNGATIVIPEGLTEIHHEVELGVVIGQGGKNISVSQAMDHVCGYCLALDMTARIWQEEAKKKGLPWTAAKGFDTSLPLGDFVPKDRVQDPANLTLWLKVNDAMKQRGSTRDMLFPVHALVSEVSKIHSLAPGDLILTGTPAGVGPVRAGDAITAGIEELGINVRFSVQ